MDFDLTDKFSHLKSSLGTSTEKEFCYDKVPEYSIHELFSQPIVKVLPQIRTSLIQCTEFFLHKGTFYREKTSALLKMSLLELLHSVLPRGSHSDLCEKVLNFIYDNYSSRELTNTDIADEFGYHPYYLNEIIKEGTGKTLHRQLSDTRINMAKNFLLTTSYSVEQISWKCGFSSTSYFVKTFREIVGMTPKKYKTLYFHREL